MKLDDCKCGGSGYYEDPGRPNLRECVCAYLRRIAATMPAWLRSAKVQRAHASNPLVASPRVNAYVEGQWEDVQALAKVLYITQRCGLMSLIDETLIKDVYVGAYEKKARNPDYVGVVYNSMSDLVDPPDLLLLRLNTFRPKNEALASAVEQAVRQRLDYGRPTWLISDPETPWQKGATSWSEDLQRVIEESFAYHVVPKVNERTARREADRPFAGLVPTLDKTVVEEPRRKREERPTGLDAIYGAGVKPAAKRRGS